ncbi:MocR-like pyridoxine biosynthesis transcription factor PdxR [Actinomadura harenae]|uniref:PLP-dependent aminotransferase family protein n=1 Tax=Actinomadura harenae TaxID=2483351 RepID=A0A3M2M4U2_9ACTN|nr:PLP-dependent aminotransferase family protein [Actinomadura harenae]RMI44492.1 PLP-dependent aminotransferase family protein [Actinomadura harenae]
MTDLHLALDHAAGRLAAQLAAGCRDAIRTGRLAAGTRLPSSRDLARDLGVSRGVVVTAYEQLIAEGFLVARRGDGTRVAPNARPVPESSAEGRQPEGRPAPRRHGQLTDPPPRLAPSAPEEGDAAGVRFDLTPGRPDLAAFPRSRWLAAYRTALQSVPHRALTYPDPGGVPELRAGLAAYLGRVRAAHADAAQVVIMNGVALGLSSAVRALVAAGRTTLALEDPASERQLPMLEATGARIVRVPVDAGGLDVAALARTGADAVLVTPAHQYPTGVVLAPERRAALVDWARAADAVIVEDDYDAEFRYDGDPVGCLQGVAPERTVLLGSVSKALAPGMRLGWAVAPPWMASDLREHRELSDLGGPVLDQHAFARFLADGAYDRHLRAMRRRYRSRRDALVAALHEHIPDAVVRGISAGVHLYLELPAGTSETAVVDVAAESGVRVSGASEMWSAEQRRPALVLGYAALAEPRLHEAARVLGAAVTRTRRHPNRPSSEPAVTRTRRHPNPA